MTVIRLHQTQPWELDDSNMASGRQETDYKKLVEEDAEIDESNNKAGFQEYEEGDIVPEGTASTNEFEERGRESHQIIFPGDE